MAKPKPKVVVKYKPYPVYPFPGVRALRRKLSLRRYIEYNAWTRGPGGSNNQAWTAIFVGLFILRQVRKRSGPQLLSKDVLKAGDGLVIRALPPLTKAERRAGRRG
jgi:hypothetical protein